MDDDYWNMRLVSTDTYSKDVFVYHFSSRRILDSSARMNVTVIAVSLLTQLPIKRMPHRQT